MSIDVDGGWLWQFRSRLCRFAADVRALWSCLLGNHGACIPRGAGLGFAGSGGVVSIVFDGGEVIVRAKPVKRTFGLGGCPPFCLFSMWKNDVLAALCPQEKTEPGGFAAVGPGADGRGCP